MKEFITKSLSSILILLMSAMILAVLWGVFTRYAIGHQASWTEELARFLLIWVGLLGAAYAAGKKMHLAIDLLQPKLEPKARNRLRVFIIILIILFAFSVLIVGGLRLIYITNVLGQISPALQVPMYLVYIVLPLSGMLVIYFKATELAAFQFDKE